MWSKVFRNQIGAVAWVVIVLGIAFATGHGQSQRKASAESYEVVFTDYMDVDFADQAGYRIRIIGVSISPDPVTKQFLLQTVSKLRGQYPSDKEFTILFSADKAVFAGFLGKKDSEDEASRFLSAMRGVYMLRSNPQREELRYFPIGMTEKDIQL